MGSLEFCRQFDGPLLIFLGVDSTHPKVEQTPLQRFRAFVGIGAPSPPPNRSGSTPFGITSTRCPGYFASTRSSPRPD